MVIANPTASFRLDTLTLPIKPMETIELPTQDHQQKNELNIQSPFRPTTSSVSPEHASNRCLGTVCGERRHIPTLKSTVQTTVDLQIGHNEMHRGIVLLRDPRKPNRSEGRPKLLLLPKEETSRDQLCSITLKCIQMCKDNRSNRT